MSVPCFKCGAARSCEHRQVTAPVDNFVPPVDDAPREGISFSKPRARRVKGGTYS